VPAQAARRVGGSHRACRRGYADVGHHSLVTPPCCTSFPLTGDPESLAAWRRICEASRKEFQALYNRLGVKLEVRARGRRGQQGASSLTFPQLSSQSGQVHTSVRMKEVQVALQSSKGYVSVGV
jgi:hypothetical protein